MKLFGAIGALGLGLFLLGPWYMLLAGYSIREPAFIVAWVAALVVGFVASMAYLGATARRERESRENEAVAAAVAAQRQAEAARQAAEQLNELQNSVIGLLTDIIEAFVDPLRNPTTATEDEPSVLEAPAA